MLTVKEEKFVQNLLKGMSQREAYKNSYSASKMKNETIDSKASILFKKEKIRTRYQELIDKTAKKSIMSAQERMEYLTKIITGDVKHTSYGSDGESYYNEAYISDKMKAIDILNKMDGVYIQKIESNSNVKIENPYKELTIEELKKLAGE